HVGDGVARDEFIAPCGQMELATGRVIAAFFAVDKDLCDRRLYEHSDLKRFWGLCRFLVLRFRRRRRGGGRTAPSVFGIRFSTCSARGELRGVFALSSRAFL